MAWHGLAWSGVVFGGVAFLFLRWPHRRGSSLGLRQVHPRLLQEEVELDRFFRTRPCRVFRTGFWRYLGAHRKRSRGGTVDNNAHSLHPRCRSKTTPQRGYPTRWEPAYHTNAKNRRQPRGPAASQHGVCPTALWDKNRSFGDINNSLSHQRASEGVSTAEGASKASSLEQANE